MVPQFLLYLTITVPFVLFFSLFFIWPFPTSAIPAYREWIAYFPVARFMTLGFPYLLDLHRWYLIFLRFPYIQSLAPGIASYEVELVKNKLKILENRGLLGYEIKQILEKDPRFLCPSEAKIEKNMEFLTCTLGFKPNVVVKYPILLNLSVEKRMRPRYKVIQYVNSLRAGKDLSFGLLRCLLLTEGDFIEKFLSGNPEVEMLYDKYKGMMADVEVPELLPTH